MMCLGSYLVLMNAFALSITCLAINRKSARKTLFIAILAILAIAPMIGGIIMLFTPIEMEGHNPGSKSTKPETPTKRPGQDIIVTREIDVEIDEKEIMANKLRSLKLRIDQGVATTDEKNEFELLLTEYRSNYPK